MKEARLRLAYGLTLAPTDRRWTELLAGPVERLRAFLGEDAPRAFVLCAVLPVALSPHVSPAARRAFLREMRALPFTAPASGSPQTLAEFPEAAHLLRPSTYLFLNLPSTWPASKSKTLSKAQPQACAQPPAR